MTTQVLSQLTLQLVLYIIFSIFVFATIEVIKGFSKSIMNGKFKITKNILRFINFGIGYAYAWIFNFQLANNIMKLANSGRGNVLHNHVNYLIVASLMYVGAKKIWTTYYSKNKDILNELQELKKSLKN